MSIYIRLKLTEPEARAIRSVMAKVVEDEELSEQVFSNGLDVSAVMRATGKIVDELVKERRVKENGDAGKKKVKKK